MTPLRNNHISTTMTPLRNNCISTTKLKDTEVGKTPDEDFKSFLVQIHQQPRKKEYRKAYEFPLNPTQTSEQHRGNIIRMDEKLSNLKVSSMDEGVGKQTSEKQMSARNENFSKLNKKKEVRISPTD